MKAIIGASLVVGLLGITACGSSSSTTTTAPSNKNAAGVRARQYAFYKDERTGNTAAACAQVVKANQEELMKEEKVSSCQAAFFKIWNTNAGVYSEADEAKRSAKATKEDEAEIARAKILVVGDRATVIDPRREETEEYLYSNGHWLFVKQEPNTEATAGLKKQAEEAEAKNEAVIKAGEAQGTGNAIKESG